MRIAVLLFAAALLIAPVVSAQEDIVVAPETKKCEADKKDGGCTADSKGEICSEDRKTCMAAGKQVGTNLAGCACR